MRVSSIRLKNFKRFTDLLIHRIPESARLVMIVGPNGCGKSSLFDAFLHWYGMRVGFGHTGDHFYYRKNAVDSFDWHDVVEVHVYGSTEIKKGNLYVRTAYRNDPDFSIDAFRRPENPSEGIRIRRLVDNDQAVSDNYRRLIYDTMSGVYDDSNNEKKVRDLREELIGSVRESMKRVFDDLIINSISDPLGTGTFFFEKGTSKSYHYKNLSGGEKAAFDILLDVHIKRRFFADAIYCIDEIETHLHTRVQGRLLKEIYNVMPVGCQLWSSTHSLGVLRAAQELAATDPSSVCLIDFEGVNADTPHELVPSSLGRVSWEKMLSIAIDDLSARIAPQIIVVCEGSSLGSRRKDFDAEIYNRIFASSATDVLFVSGGSSEQVHSVGISISEMLTKIAPNSKVLSLADRDDMSSTEIAEREAAGAIVLPERNIESYLFADDVLEAFLRGVGQVDRLTEVLEIKKRAIANSVARRNASDDMKSASGEIYTEIKKSLGLTRIGSHVAAFMRDTLATLIIPGTETYRSLYAAIIERLPEDKRRREVVSSRSHGHTKS